MFSNSMADDILSSNIDIKAINTPFLLKKPQKNALDRQWRLISSPKKTAL